MIMFLKKIMELEKRIAKLEKQNQEQLSQEFVEEFLNQIIKDAIPQGRF
jgi:hypothetical protein